jgi:hypothetical protein
MLFEISVLGRKDFWMALAFPAINKDPVTRP